MGVFTDILKAIGLMPKEAAAPEKSMGKEGTKQPDISKYTEKKQLTEVDVAKNLDAMATAKGRDPKDWRVSIVELMTLLGIDSSHANRVELAKELGAPESVMGGDSAAMNIWLHKEVMKKVAANGGAVPKELMD